MELPDVDGPVLQNDDTLAFLLFGLLVVFALIADAEFFLGLSTIEDRLVILQEIHDVLVLVKFNLEKNVIREVAVKVRDILHFLKLILFSDLGLAVVVDI